VTLGISDAIELTKRVGELVKGAATLGLQETIIDLREAVLNTKDEVLRLREENQALRSQVAGKSAWEETSARYKLVATPTGGTVYETEGPPAHYACPSCFASEKAIPLQHMGGDSYAYKCPKCQAHYPIREPKPRPQVLSPNLRGGPHGWMHR
jgi:hypothetical protein